VKERTAIFGVGTIVVIAGLAFLKLTDDPPPPTTSSGTPRTPDIAREQSTPSQPHDERETESQAPAAVRSETQPQAARTAPTSAGDPTNLVALGMEIPTLRQQFAAEQKETVRAAQLEFELRNYLQEQAANGTYNVGHVECRTTLCEIQVTATNREGRTEWSQVLAELRRQPWASAIESTVHSAQEDEAMNTVGLVTFLRLRTVQDR
jgi:hypothetical protein